MTAPTMPGPPPHGGGPVPHPSHPSPRKAHAMPRYTERAPKGRDRDRDDRRAMTDLLLARTQRGVILPAEGALLAEHVREEQRAGDETRQAMAGTTRALEATRAELAQHREAADAAIVEAEQRAEIAEAALVRVEVLASQLEAVAAVALRVPDREFYAAVARSLRGALDGPKPDTAHAA